MFLATDPPTVITVHSSEAALVSKCTYTVFILHSCVRKKRPLLLMTAESYIHPSITYCSYALTALNYFVCTLYNIMQDNISYNVNMFLQLFTVAPFSFYFKPYNI